MPIDYSKFDHVGDSDEEETTPKPAAKGKAAPSPSPGAAKEAAKSVLAGESSEHAKPLDDAPQIEIPEGAFLQYFTDSMTAPQRMQTLVHFWNSADQTERVEFLRHLIDIINNPRISNRIKGGQEILRDLDTKFYAGVTYPEKWLEYFKGELDVDAKKVVFEKLFKKLDAQEQGLVLGTLM
eukprot:TRINITY_DN51642_c0_g1_i1.p1 TRINITY_DN51642_c0_g1~~TRINITY_DN51642_c0_g1_i1.p1  ORF type:complete len:202 (+),score=46.21 TRINITY_DN51642_c0_g1_i1:66-608(+)